MTVKAEKKHVPFDFDFYFSLQLTGLYTATSIKTGAEYSLINMSMYVRQGV